MAGTLLMPPPHLTLPTNQSLSQLHGKVPSVITEASGYLLCTYKNLLRRFSSRFWLSSFHTCSLFLSTKQRMLDKFCPIPKCLTTHSSYHRFLLMQLLVSSQLRLKAKKSQGREATLLKGPTFLPRGRVGARGLQPPLLNHATSFANQAHDQIVSMV